MRLYEYKLVQSPFFSGGTCAALKSAITALETEVQTHLSSGWRCQGGAVIDHTAGIAYQTMSRSSKFTQSA